MKIEKVNGFCVPSNDMHLEEWKSGTTVHTEQMPVEIPGLLSNTRQEIQDSYRRRCMVWHMGKGYGAVCKKCDSVRTRQGALRMPTT